MADNGQDAKVDATIAATKEAADKVTASAKHLTAVAKRGSK